MCSEVSLLAGTLARSRTNPGALQPHVPAGVATHATARVVTGAAASCASAAPIFASAASSPIGPSAAGGGAVGFTSSIGGRNADGFAKAATDNPAVIADYASLASGLAFAAAETFVRRRFDDRVNADVSSRRQSPVLQQRHVFQCAPAKPRPATDRAAPSITAVGCHTVVLVACGHVSDNADVATENVAVYLPVRPTACQAPLVARTGPCSASILS